MPLDAFMLLPPALPSFSSTTTSPRWPNASAAVNAAAVPDNPDPTTTMREAWRATIAGRLLGLGRRVVV